MVISNPGATRERTFTYDDNGNLTSINAPSTPDFSRVFAYDQLSRLTHAEGPWGNIDYTYDDVGNRLTKSESEVTEFYTYNPGTNQLDVVINGGSTAYTHDTNGNIIGINNKILTYNQDNRLIRVEENNDILGEYTYNGLGQRILKTVDGTTTVFHYDFDGNIIGESQLNGNFTKEYIYYASSRLAMADVATEEVYFYGNDKLGTPQVLTDSTNKVVWEANYKPSGEAEVHPNSSVENNFRFPGQYFDNETGLHYNYFRYYDPSTGRYLTPDPIGQWGGLNLFTYVDNNPVMLVDSLGLRCTYSQSTGQMTCVDDQTGEQYYNETGYSGTGQGRNNPDMQDVPNTGPIPRGRWGVGPTYDSPNTGRNTMLLTPQAGNECENTERDCSSFRIHGNNTSNDASHGCIVLPPNRTQIPQGETIDVVR